MRRKILAIGFVSAVVLGSVGCKSASKLAWWKTAENGSGESTVLAHSAPALPSEIARQTENFASTEINITPGNGGGTAAPYVPTAPPTTPSTVVAANTAPPAYPSTGASSFSPSTTSQASAAIPSQSANLGSVAMPYDPNAVPAPPASNNVPTASIDTGANRYASTAPASSAPAFNPTTSTPPPTTGYPSTGDRYGTPSQTLAATPTPPAAAQQFAAAPPANTPSSPITPTPPSPPSASRYDNYGAPSVTPTQTTPPVLAQSTPITPTPSAAPYRPGGTSDYPSQGALEIATRPTNTSGTNATSAPAYNPDGQAIPSQAPRYR